MFSKLAYSTLALTVSLGTVMSCQAEVTGTNLAAAFDRPQQINAGDLNVGYVDIGPKDGQPVILFRLLSRAFNCTVLYLPARPIQSQTKTHAFTHILNTSAR